MKKKIPLLKTPSVLLARVSFLLILFSIKGFGQLSITTANTTITQNFDGLPNTGTGLSQSGSIFASGWSFLETGSNSNVLYQAGNGSSNSGDTYSYGTTSATDRAFGMLQSGNLSSILGFKFTNNTGVTVTSLVIGYTGETWRLASASDNLAFSYQLSNVALNAASGWTSVSGLTFTTANYWLSAILIEPAKTQGITRETLRLAFEKENIESRPLWKPMHLQPVFASCPYYGTNVAEAVFEKGLCLPSGSNLSNEDRERIKKVIHQVFQK